MRTKTLLMAAAALAAGITYTQAQGVVYSQNVVGYVNVSIPGNHFALIANQLDLTPGGGSNTVNAVLNNGLVSASGGAAQSILLEWTGSSFEPFGYYNQADAGAGFSPGWYDLNTGNYATNNLYNGQAVFLQNAASSNITVTLTGQVDQGTNVANVAITPGFGFYSEATPLAGTPLDSPSVNFPAVSSADTFQLYLGAAGYGDPLQYYDAADAAPSPAGWYDLNTGAYEDTNSAAWPQVGQGFLINHGGATSNWVYTFQVQ